MPRALTSHLVFGPHGEGLHGLPESLLNELVDLIGIPKSSESSVAKTIGRWSAGFKVERGEPASFSIPKRRKKKKNFIRRETFLKMLNSYYNLKIKMYIA